MKKTVIIICAFLLSAASVMPGCGGGDRSPAYEAERELFEARKLSSQLTFPTVNREFLSRTLAAYRDIVDTWSGEAHGAEGLGLLVVTAQMELAELEFKASMFEDAKADFLRAYELAADIPPARANALWSSAYISRESGDPEEALRLFKKFHSEYMTPDRILDTARLNSRYILTPIRIAEICRSLADEDCAIRWLGEAETAYTFIIRSNVSGDLGREARYDLVSTYLLWERWDEARQTILEMRRLYGEQADAPSLLYLEAQVELNGYDDKGGAIAAFDRIITEYPRSREAPTALLMKGNILQAMGMTDEAALAYGRILEDYGESGAEAVEAMWQLALLEESRDNWVEASLHYKSVYTNFPTTIQGLEAPLRIAAHYRSTGEKEAMRAAYERAAEHYRELASTIHSEMVQIVAEQYYVRTLIEMESWEEAARRLLVLPRMYPQYHSFKENCLMAASIFENKLGDSERAAEVLQKCVSSYPGTPLAEEAGRQLRRIREGR